MFNLLQLPKSVFQSRPSRDRSDRYSTIQTLPLVKDLINKGFEPQSWCETNTRKDEWKGYQKHVIKFGIPGTQGLHGQCQLLFGNSFNGSSQAWLALGYNVFVCSNGIVAYDAVQKVSVRHTRFKILDFDSLVNQTLDKVPTIQSVVKRMQDTEMDIMTQLEFTQKAVGLRWEMEELPFPMFDLMKGIYKEQEVPTVWNVFNRVQSNLIRGFHYEIGGKVHKVAPIKGLDSNLRINRALWGYAEEALV